LRMSCATQQRLVDSLRAQFRRPIAVARNWQKRVRTRPIADAGPSARIRKESPAGAEHMWSDGSAKRRSDTRMLYRPCQEDVVRRCAFPNVTKVEFCASGPTCSIALVCAVHNAKKKCRLSGNNPSGVVATGEERLHCGNDDDSTQRKSQSRSEFRFLHRLSSGVVTHARLPEKAPFSSGRSAWRANS
jgi:hypothetical protein